MAGRELTKGGERIMVILQIGMLMLLFLILGPVHAQQTEQMNMDILKEKIKADKKLIVATNMTLTDAEGKDFWPLRFL
jgi:recombinational DNA repair protein RecR